VSDLPVVAISLQDRGAEGALPRRHKLRFAPQIRGTVEFAEAAIGIGEDRVGLGQAIGLEGGDAGKAAEEGLKVLHHDRAPGWFAMEP
jgi:hypothetical protein